MGRLCREQPPPTTEWCLQPADTGPRATVAVMWAEGDFLPKVRGHVSRCQEHRAPSLFPSAPHTGAGGAWYLLGKRRAQMVPDSEPWPTPPPTNVGGSPSTGGPQQGPNPGSGCCTGVPRSSEVVNQPLVPPRDQVKSQCGWEVSARAQQGKHGSGAGSWGAGRPRQQQPWAFAHTGRQSQGGSKVETRREGMCVTVVQRSGSSRGGQEGGRVCCSWGLLPNHRQLPVPSPGSQ